MGYALRQSSFTARTPQKKTEKRLYLATPSSQDAPKLEKLISGNSPKSPANIQSKKDYSELFNNPGSLLFGNGSRQLRTGHGGLDGSTWVPPPTKQVRKKVEVDVGDSGLGYFVFLPSGGSPSGQASTQAPNSKQDASKSASGSSSSPPLPPNPKSEPSPHPQKFTGTDTDPNPWNPDPDHLASLHRARLAREALEAQKGEEYWVSCGGVLRDSNGRRDLERTRKVREELALREKERKLLETWEEYERRWTSLVKRVRAARKGKEKSTEDGDAMDGVEEEEDHLTFNDIPWPISASFAPPPPPSKPQRLSSFSFSSTPTAPSSSPYPPPPEHILSQLTPDNIRSFLLETLTVRGTKVTPRERIRSSMLRWHPDKMGRVVERVRDEEERELVVRGVGEVVRALQRLMVEVGKERGA